MKHFHIKAPRPGKTTCTLVHQFYDKESKRTKTRYLGSFNRQIDPANIPAGLRLRPSVELTDEEQHQVVSWLRIYGTFGQPASIPAEVMAEARRRVQNELQWMTPVQKLEHAIETMQTAALSVEEACSSARDRGVKLSKGLICHIGTDEAICKNELDSIKIHSNRLRVAHDAFMSTLQSSGLVKRRAENARSKGK